MSFYFEPVWQGMNAGGYGNCTKDVHAAVLEMDNIMADADKAKALKLRFLGAGADTNSNAGFADALSVLFYQWQSYGVDGGTGAVRDFCDWISTDRQSGTTAPAEGWAASKGVDFVLKQWVTWPNWATAVNMNLGSNCKGPAEGSKANRTLMAHSPLKMEVDGCDLETASSDPDAISWTYQYCTQWGFFQYSNIGDHQLVSKYNDQQHQIDYCNRQFPDGKSSGLLPAIPKADETNKHFGGWTIRPSQVFWSGGQFDPWRTLSPLSDQDFAPKATFTQDIPTCAAPPTASPPSYGDHDDDDENDDEDDDAEERAQRSIVKRGTDALFSFLVPDAEHCFDFRTSVKQGAPARQLFNDALTGWLKCFKSGLNSPPTHY
ncbi:hypothetical protein BT63DRAFT_428200 [Microthyrium microscopicum]|uniref:Uncharacterized protein n=1 Tax=Microthyrium microscopicum TaxID=703497 RepID=A0A6A6U2T8_9PEZI|nr:hypothetical protein BT63DRAFT_428200 [Microthyrium microscopicum]